MKLSSGNIQKQVLKYELLFLFSHVLLQSSDYAFIYLDNSFSRNTNIYGPLIFLNYLNQQFQITLVFAILSLSIISISSIILAFRKCYIIEFLQYYGYPIVIYIITLKLHLNQSVYTYFIYIPALIVFQFIFFLKVLKINIRYQPFSYQNFTRNSNYRTLLLFIKINAYSFLPLLFSWIYIVCFIGLICLIRSVLYFSIIQRENVNIEYVVAICEIWQWISLFKYIVVINQLNPRVLDLCLLILVYMVIYKQKFMLWLLERKYLSLFQKSNKQNGKNQIIKISIIFNLFNFSSINYHLPWSSQFIGVVEYYLQNLLDKYSNIKEQQSIILNLINQIYILPLKNDKLFIENNLWRIIDQYIKNGNCSLQFYIYICQIFPTKSIQNSLKLFYLYYYEKQNNNQIGYFQNIHLELCFQHLKNKIKKDRKYQKFINAQSLLDLIINTFQQYYINQKYFFNFIGQTYQNLDNFKDYLFKKNQIRLKINSYINQYKQWDMNKMIPNILNYLVYQYFDHNNNLAIKNFKQALNSYNYNQINLFKESISNNQIICLCSGINQCGLIFKSNNRFKNLLQIKIAINNKKKLKQYNINEFLLSIWKDNHQILMRNWNKRQIKTQHFIDKCYLLTLYSKNLIQVSIKLYFYTHLNSDLIFICQIQPIQQSFNYQICSQNQNIIYQSPTYRKINTQNNLNLLGLDQNQNKIITQYKTIFNQHYKINKTIPNFQLNETIFSMNWFKQIQIDKNNQIKQKKYINNNNKIIYQTKKKFFQLGFSKKQILQIAIKKFLIKFIILFACYLATWGPLDFYLNSYRTHIVLNLQFKMHIQNIIFVNEHYKALDFLMLQQSKRDQTLSTQLSNILNIIDQSRQNILQGFQQTNQILKQIRQNQELLDYFFNKDINLKNFTQSFFTNFNLRSSLYIDYSYQLSNTKIYLEINKNLTNLLQNIYKQDQLISQVYNLNNGLLQQIDGILKKQIQKSKQLLYFLHIMFFSVGIIIIICFYCFYLSLQKKIIQFITIPLQFSKQSLRYLQLSNQYFLEMNIKQKTPQNLQRKIQITSKLQQQDQSKSSKYRPIKQINQFKQAIKASKFFLLCMAILFFIIYLSAGYSLFYYVFETNKLEIIEKNSIQLSTFSNQLMDSLKTLFYHNLKLDNSSLTRQIYSLQSRNVIENSNLLSLQQIFGIEKANNLLLQDICSKQRPWKCLNFVLKQQRIIKLLISSSISQIRQLQYNTYIPQHMQHYSGTMFLGVYKRFAAIKLHFQNIGKQIFNSFFNQFTNQKMFNTIKLISTISIFLFVTIKLIQLLKNGKIYQQEIFKIAPFHILIGVQKYNYYINYFQSMKNYSN